MKIRPEEVPVDAVMISVLVAFPKLSRLNPARVTPAHLNRGNSLIIVRAYALNARSWKQAAR
jgi:hypothetical protein